MHTVITFIFCVLMFSKVNAQQKTEARLKNYDLVISFNSICCGTPSSEFLRDFLNKYRKKNKIIPDAWLLPGCGREGEFKILLSLSKLKKCKKIKLNQAIKDLIPAQNSKNKTLKPSTGNINIAYNLSGDNITNCSGQIMEWKFASN